MLSLILGLFQEYVHQVVDISSQLPSRTSSINDEDNQSTLDAKRGR